MKSITELKKWLFQRDDLPAEQVEVPHDWAIKGPFDRNNDCQITKIVQDGDTRYWEHTGRTGGLPHVGVGRYSCSIPGPSSPERCVYLDFEGVMSHAKVYINGELAGSRNFGYISFRVDIGKFLHDGTNKLEVTAENFPDASRWYPGAGIYRPVRLLETDPVHFGHWSLIVRYLPDTNSLQLSGAVENFTNKEQEGTICLSSPLFDMKTISCKIPRDGYRFIQILPLKEHQKWSVDNPVLYPVTFRIEAGIYSDEETVRYGVRSCKFDSEYGFFLNDKHLKLNGVCMHHDVGPIGTAFNRAAAKRQLEILRKMGCNAIRTSHNPPAPGFLDLCDEMGFLVMDEAFDCWHTAKVKNDYHLCFDTDSDMDLHDLVCRDRNHPSVILWSIGNEVMEIYHPESGGEKIAEHLTSLIHSLDTDRPVSMGLNLGPNTLETALRIQEHVDVTGWNYQPQNYPTFKRYYKKKPMIGAETMSAVSSRGIYYFPAREYIHYLDHYRNTNGENYCSSYVLDTNFWSTLPDTEIVAQNDFDYVAGQFIWTGFDYLGEPTPFKKEWPVRSSCFGCVDLVGLPKDLFYLMQSCWTEKPMVHIVPHHWNWNHGQTLDLHVFSNCDTVELFLNGNSLGMRTPRPKSAVLYRRLRFIWDNIVWQPGELKAVGYRNGEVRTEEIIKTAGTPEKIVLKTERCECAADGEDMLFVEVSVADKENNLLPNDRSHVHFSLIGDSLKIAAADAGDTTSTELFHLPECTLFSGKAVVYLRSTGIPGKAELTATCKGLESAKITLYSEK